MNIYLDIDGVLADWISGALAAHELDPEPVLEHWATLSPKPWCLSKVLGISRSAMWAPVHRAGADFWADLEPLPWMAEVYEACTAVAPTILMTSPSSEPSSHAGKAEWIGRHFGRRFRDYMIGAPKHRCAHPGAVLVDDSPEGCKRFEEAGGRTLLFPSVGNVLAEQATPGVGLRLATALRGLRDEVQP